jgi:hypothetical protein
MIKSNQILNDPKKFVRVLVIGTYLITGLIFGIYVSPSAQEVLIHTARNNHHRMRLLAQVSPPPKAVRMIKSPF